jgi:hypothetical protein
MAAPRVSDEHWDYIRKYYRRYPSQLVAEQLGMSVKRLENIAYYYGLKKNKGPAKVPLQSFCEWRYGVTKEELNIHFEEVRKETFKPRPNIFQRIIGFLLRGDW